MVLDFNKPLKTRGGQDVEIISTTGRGAFPIIGYRGNNTGISTWDSKGRFSFVQNNFDLINK